MRFEDVKAGQCFDLGQRLITAAEIVRFAETYDPQPFHLSDAGSTANPVFQHLSASGWHVGVILNGMLGKFWRSQGLNGLAGAGIEALTWDRPVYAGDMLQGSVVVVSARASKSKPERGIMAMRGTLTNQEALKVLDMVITCIYLR